MLTQILYNKEGRPVSSGSAFADVTSDAWHSEAVAWAAARGIVSGYGNGVCSSQGDKFVASSRRSSDSNGCASGSRFRADSYSAARHRGDSDVVGRGGISTATGISTRGGTATTGANEYNKPQKEVLSDGKGTEISITTPDTPDAAYTITFNANGGTVNPASLTTDANGKLPSLPTPSRNGYTFNGWFTAPSSGAGHDESVFIISLTSQ